MPRSNHFLLLAALSALATPACRPPSPVTRIATADADCRESVASVPATVAHAVAPSVRWIMAPDSRERTPLDRWCAAVGPAVSSVLATSADSVVTSLAVVTWNTHVGGADIPGLVRDLRAGRLTDGAPVQHFVLLLQEAYRASADVPDRPDAMMPRRIRSVPERSERIDIVQTARDLGLAMYYVPSMSNGRDAGSAIGEDRGNAILSTLPLDDLTAIELPYEGQRRVAATATIRGVNAAGEPFAMRVVSAHLDNRSRSSRLLQSLGSGRARQARALVSALGSDSATVLGGDLNTWSLSFLERAIGVLERHFPLGDNGPAQSTLSVAGGLGGLRVDRLMFRLPSHFAAESRRLDDRRGSDHHPLIGRVTLPGVRVTESPGTATQPRS